MATSAADVDAGSSPGEAAQHNLSALQARLQALQLENSALTKDLCLKENYVQLKEQQVRALQRRLEELEASVAGWKDRYLQAQTVAQAPSQASEDTARAAGEWTPWVSKAGSGGAADARAKSLRNARALLDKLSASDRDKVRPLLELLERDGDGDGGAGGGAGDGLAAALAAAEPWERRFHDVREELSRVLLLYLLPALSAAAGERGAAGELRCYSRTYAKQTMDFRIECRPRAAEPTAAAAAATEAETEATADESDESEAPSERKEPPAPAAAPGPAAPSLDASVRSSGSSIGDFASLLESERRTDTGGSSSGASDAPAAAAYAAHVFDCVDCERRGAAPVAHGPRELHPTRALYVSRALGGAAAGGPEGGKRRFTVAPSRTAPTFAVESTRLQSLNALPSPSAGGGGAMGPPTPEGEGERRSGASSFISSVGAGKDGKIKKIMGSVMDRLNRHKPQLAAAAAAGAGGAGGAPGEEDESMCDGCGRGPLAGVKWVCRTCRALGQQELELCDRCYGQGVHGREGEPALFERIEEIVVLKCPRLAHERALLRLLRVGICKANLKKFSFCLTWVADLLQCRHARDLRARALEISHISPQVRAEFVRLLRDLLRRYRPDIELVSEWEPAPLAAGPALADAPASGGGGASGDADADADADASADASQLDTLRIWVKDASDASQQTQQQ